MSKLTLDEAIKHCLEVAEDNERAIDCLDLWEEEGQEQANMCRECAADHRQLAGWLKELKELRCKVFADDPLIETTIEMLDTELRETKRLLKAAVEDMNGNNICFDINACNVCTDNKCISCDTFKWRYTDEALKLIGDESDGI